MKDTEYGGTPIKALLLMASGVAFSEDYDNRHQQLARMTVEQDSAGSLAAVKQFNTRRSPPGTRFSYPSAESLVLGLILAAATKRTVSDYAAEKLWQPLGAEADATWIIDANGQEITFAYVNAVLRDWARLGLGQSRHLAGQGHRSRGLACGISRQCDSNGFSAEEVRLSIWYSADTRRFSLRGIRGRFIYVDPDLKLILVQTALGGGPTDSSWSCLRYGTR